MNILVMCHGNLCRSPACAEVLTQSLGNLNHEVRSRGFKISARRAARKMRRAMACRGYGHDMDLHVPRLVTREDAEWADVVVLMGGGNRRRWERLFPDLCDDLVMLGHLVGRQNIPDPGFMRSGSVEFEHTVDVVIEASLALAENLEKKT